MNNRKTNTFQRNRSLEEALLLIKEAVDSEKNDLDFFNSLLNQAANSEDIAIITDIMEDKQNHIKMLKKLYYDLTGISLGENLRTYYKTRNHQEYIDSLKEALFSGMIAIKKQREILKNMPDSKKYDILMEIITDEITHMGKYNYLISKNLNMVE